MFDPGNPAWLENAVLIYGPRKGGTTLFQNLLDGSSQLFIYPAELKLKYLSKARDMKPSEYFLNSKVPANDRRVVPETTASGEWEARSYFRHTREYNVDVEAFDWTAYQAEWMADPDVQQDVGQLVRKDAVRVFRNSRFHATSPVGWCAKEVGGRPREIIKLWKKIFPNGRLLLITRDHRMVARSVLQDRRRVNQHLSLWNLVKQIREPMIVNTAIQSLNGRPDVYILRYEDLVRDTPGVMKGVANFLRIPFDEVFCRPTLLGEEVVVRTSSRAEKSVFVADVRWTEGLSQREKLVAGAIYWTVNIWNRVRGFRSSSRWLAQ